MERYRERKRFITLILYPLSSIIIVGYNDFILWYVHVITSIYIMMVLIIRVKYHPIIIRDVVYIYIASQKMIISY